MRAGIGVSRPMPRSGSLARYGAGGGRGQWAGGRGVLVEGSCRIGEHGTWGRQWRIG
jgi:hypothetical protein